MSDHYCPTCGSRLVHIVDVLDPNAAIDKVETLAKARAAFLGDDPERITNIGTPLWMSFLPEAKWEVIKDAILKGEDAEPVFHRIKYNGHVEDAEVVDAASA